MEFNVGGKVTVSNFGNIAEDSTIKLKKAGGSEVTFTMKNSGASGDFEFNKGGDANALATNLAAKINAHADFGASATGVVVSLSVTNGGSVKVTSSDAAKLAASNVLAWGSAQGGANDWDVDGDTDSADLSSRKPCLIDLGKLINRMLIK